MTMHGKRTHGTAASKRRSESGQIFVWCTFLLPILLIAAGLSFDVGNMINLRDELGGAVDAAALAGAEALQDPSASDAHVRSSVANVARENEVPTLAKNQKAGAVVLNRNPSNDPTGDIVLGRWNFATRSFTVATTPVDISQVNAVQVNARLSRVAGSLPLAFGGVLGVPSFDTVKTAMSVTASPIQERPTAPIAIDVNLFTGKAKGFTPPNDIVVSTKGIANMAWTGFFQGGSASTINNLVQSPNLIPQLKIGDVINLASGSKSVAYSEMKKKWPPNSVLIVPVVTFTPGATWTTDPDGAPDVPGTVQGFAAIRVIKIEDKGNPKYLHGEVTSTKTTGDPTTIAECYGLNCRSFLVN
jgi:Flp pilus assembly protein TadG